MQQPVGGRPEDHLPERAVGGGTQPTPPRRSPRRPPEGLRPRCELANLWKLTSSPSPIWSRHRCASRCESAPNCSAHAAYSASMRAGDGVVHGLGTTVTTASEVLRVLRRLDGEVQRPTGRPFRPGSRRRRSRLVLRRSVDQHVVFTRHRGGDDSRHRRRSTRCGGDPRPGRTPAPRRHRRRTPTRSASAGRTAPHSRRGPRGPA